MEYRKSSLALHTLKGAVIAAVLLLAVGGRAADGNVAPTTQAIPSGSAEQPTSYTGTVLYSFGTFWPDGINPTGNGMVMDKSGNIFAATETGGPFQACGGNGSGSMVELTKNGSGGWNESDIHDFDWLATSGGNGCLPQGLLAMDSDGNLYGTTIEGGNNTCDQQFGYGCGTVFELSQVDGVWTETTLYSFGATSTDGYWPFGGLTLANSTGTSLYGTTPYGGANGAGAVWKLTHTKPTKKNPGGWRETILYSFPAAPSADGGYPQAGLLFEGGNLYGVTDEGGFINGVCCGAGTIYELENGSSGWSFHVLHTFNPVAGDGGNQPGGTAGPPAMDVKGNLYGTTMGGGAYLQGTAWELVYSPTNGTYSEQVLYSFSGDAENPNWGLVYSQGSWFGTTGGWGNYTDGNVFKLTYSEKTGWKETTIFDQFGQFDDGSEVDEPGWNQLIVDKSGNLYGMGQLGGYGLGGVFEVSPNP